MREFVKGVVLLCLLTSGTVGAVAWYEAPPTDLIWKARIIGPIVAVGCFLLFLIIHFKRDRVPDFLYQLFGGYLERGGLCFAFDTFVEAGVCYVRVHFQNRFSRPCYGRIALRPARGFFLTRSDIELIEFDVDCPEAGYGVACVAVPVPLQFQGTTQKFDVGATVHYPEWRGRTLRYRDGAAVRANAQFTNSFGILLALGGALSGQVGLSNSASVAIMLPMGVTETVPFDSDPDVQILWKLGDLHPLIANNAFNASGRERRDPFRKPTFPPR